LFWDCLGAVLDCFEPFQAVSEQFRTFSGCFRAVLGQLEAISCCFWAILGLLRVVLGLLWAILSRFEAVHLDRFKPFLKVVLPAVLGLFHAVSGLS
jgi:hypothetical protein